MKLGTGKITPDRISRLDAMGFEWDPQKAQWNIMFDKLQKFKEDTGHCKVPKVRRLIVFASKFTYLKRKKKSTL